MKNEGFILNKNKDISCCLSPTNGQMLLEEVCDKNICINEFGEIVIRSFPLKAMLVIKSSFWNYLISPLILFGSLALYIFAPIKIFKHEIKSLMKYLANAKLKRLLDFAGAAIGLALLSFIFLILSLLIKLDSKGPVFYYQIRIGRNRRRKSRRTLTAETRIDRRYNDRRKQDLHGQPFVIYKFRTMREDAEKKCGPVWATDNDPRITTVGKFLRETHLDELPQLLNILRGEMSFVGPRPERPHFVSQFSHQIPDYTKRLKMKPGLTGLAQVNCGYDNSMESVMNKLKYDLEYNQNGSLYSYLKIIVMTIYQTFIGKEKDA